MKPTHLLIPIEWIKHEVEILEMEQSGSFSHSRDSKINTLNWLLREHKQISLSEEDIEKKAFDNAPEDTPDNPAYPNHTDTDIFVSGYKQALKYLLNQ